MKILTDNEKAKLGKLLSEIKDMSLEMILREVIFSDESIDEAIKIYRPETTINGIIIDERSKTVYRDGIEVKLTPKELKLLSLLMSERGKVFSKTDILWLAYGIDWDCGTNTVEVYISFLRNKIDKGFTTPMILTKQGYGYYIN